VTTWARDAHAAVSAEADTLMAEGCEREGRCAAAAAAIIKQFECLVVQGSAMLHALLPRPLTGF
jgi:hypothetical protein